MMGNIGCNAWIRKKIEDSVPYFHPEKGNEAIYSYHPERKE
jgi:hypothetical protein